MIEQKLLTLFTQSFGVEKIDDNMSIENIEGWDSMGHVGLMMSLQQEFGVTISPTDAIELTDIAKIKAFLAEKTSTA